MARVTLRLGSPISRSPNAGLGTGRAPAPRPPTAISSAATRPSRRARLLGSGVGAGSTDGGGPEICGATMRGSVATRSDNLAASRVG